MTHTDTGSAENGGRPRLTVSTLPVLVGVCAAAYQE
jgi:hypothetical protein